MTEDPASRDFNNRWSQVMELYGRRSFQEALEIALDVEKRVPEEFQGEISLGMACIYTRLGRLDSAVQSLERAMVKGH